MNCTTCGYSLWNLRARTCPECGTGFKPSDFEFALNSVQFRCPHCEQSYYGTGVRGHLVPRRFACVSCTQQVDMDDMVLLPTEGVRENQTRTERVAWADPDPAVHSGLLGTLRAGASTALMSMGKPKPLGDHLPRGSSHFRALLLAVPLNIVYWFVGFGWIFALAFAMPAMRNMSSSTALLGAIAGLLGICAVIAIGLVIVPVWCWAACTQLILRFGGSTQASLRDTANAITYASNANLVTAIPCFGMSIGWIWWAVSAIFTVQGVHRISAGRATLATLLPVLIGIVLLTGGFFGSMVLLGQATSRQFTNPGGYANEPNRAEEIGSALLAMHARDGVWPDQALRIVHDQHVPPERFISGWTVTTEQDVKVRSTDIAVFGGMTPEAAGELLDSATPLPAKVIAHRVGDMVFTYHGVPVPDADDPATLGAEDLWIAVTHPDPDVVPPTPWVSMGLDGPQAVHADGRVVALANGMMQQHVDAQNTVRARYGLAPLPPLETITFTQPAVGGAPLPPPEPEQAGSEQAGSEQAGPETSPSQPVGPDAGVTDDDGDPSP